MSESISHLPYQVISITGPDATNFLQGQCSCDVSKLTDSEVTFGTVNTPKGRMYGLFLAVKTNNGFLLRLHKTTAKKVFDQLSKYKVFFKCDMQIEDTLNIYGSIDQPTAQENHLSPYQTVTQDERRYIRLPGNIESYEIWTSEALEAAGEAEQWHINQTRNGIPELYAETQEQFILQYLNLQHLNAVSFNKGCYTGQEIIARMKFLGKLKKQTFLLHCDKEATATPGSDLFDENGKKCGELVRSHALPSEGSAALGILDLSYAETPRPVYLDESLKHAFEVHAISYS